MDKKFRKNQDILNISGIAVMVFGVWSIVKMIISWIATPGGLAQALGLAAGDAGDPFREVFYIFFLVIGTGIDIGLRFFVGFSARAESKGEKKSAAYLVIAVIMLIFAILSCVVAFQSFFKESVFDAIISVIVELTALYSLLELIISSIRLRKLKKQLAAER